MCSTLQLLGDHTFGTTSAVLEAIGSPEVLCVVAGRMFFNFKEATGRNVNAGTNWDSYTLSVIRFDEQDSVNV